MYYTYFPELIQKELVNTVNNPKIHFQAFLKCSIFRHGFDYTCSCPDGYGGVNCQLHGCGGTLTSQEVPQELTIPEVTDHVTGCIWNISSPAESRINLTVKEYVHQHCFSVTLAVFSGKLQCNGIIENVTSVQ